VIALALFATCLALPLEDGTTPAGETDVASEFILTSSSQAASQTAIERGLAYLAELQSDAEDGSISTADATSSAPVAVTALTALAFMAAGHSPDRGPYGKVVRRAVEYLLGRADRDAGSSYGYIASSSDNFSKMHGHGYATLALAEAYGMSPRTSLGDRLRDTLPAAVAAIERSQGTSGGWWYGPERSASHEGSVTICLVQALRAARNAGIRVDPTKIALAEGYVRDSQVTEPGPTHGLFRYQIGLDRTSIALTAAAISTLNATGEYGSKEIDIGIDAIWRGLYERESGLEDAQNARYPYYERLYLAQAFWQHDDIRHFQRWIADELPRVIADQRPDGSWFSREYGTAYATASNCLFLSLPEGVLPIFQR